MTLNGSMKIKIGAVGASIIGHGLMMEAVETIAVTGDVDDMYI